MNGLAPIVCGVNGSAASRGAVRAAAELGLALGRRVQLVHVAPTSVRGAAQSAAIDATEEHTTARRRAGAQVLQAATPSGPPGSASTSA